MIFMFLLLIIGLMIFVQGIAENEGPGQIIGGLVISLIAGGLIYARFWH